MLTFRLLHRPHGLGAALIAAACGAGLAQAQPAPAANMPAEKVAEPTYRCGGISSDESIAIRAEMKSHPLSLLFARPDGAYLADVAVTIQGGATPPLSFTARGPVCLVDLPPGKYSVQAAAEGMTKTQDVTLGAGAKTLDFRF